MSRLGRILLAVSASLFLLNIGITSAALANTLDPCPETELARILCPPPSTGYTYVCQDHHGIVTVHTHCKLN